ncbi:MAG: SH3 domain-containing protein, partial [Devosia sp.]|nr:SH3 domain-containing protein [Devosia sp.]
MSAIARGGLGMRLGGVAAAGLCACLQPPAHAAPAPLPSGTRACAFDALTNDPDPAGLNVRAAPSASAPILGRLPPAESADAAMGTIL